MNDQTIPAEPIVADADHEYRDETITAVTQEDGGWSITGTDGWSFWVPREHGVEPRIGDAVRFYGRGVGYVVRGLRIRDEMVFYRTADDEAERGRRQVEQWHQEQRDAFERNREDHDRRIAALPDVFQRRIAKFQTTKPDFRWQNEGYEIFTCEQAVLIAEAMRCEGIIGNSPEGALFYRGALAMFQRMSSEEQAARVPGLSADHSGNTFGMACRLAHHYLADPRLVVLEHGALTALTGCEEYGCPHPYGPAEVAS